MQAESARKTKEDDQRKTRSPSQDITSDSVTINGHEAPNQELYSNNAPLPALLPDDILAEEPLSNTSTLPMNPSIPKSSLKTKLKLLDKNSKPPKVIRHGLVQFQVLEVTQGHLPPKASKNSKHIRESWLLGQRGKSIVPRKRLGGGFVRK